MSTETVEQEAATINGAEANDQDAAAEKKAEQERKRAEAKAKKDAEKAEAKAAREKAAAEKKAAKEAEKAKRAEERANRPKVVALTLSQRRHILRLAKAGAKGVWAKGQQGVKPYEYFVQHGLAESQGTDEEKGTKYRITDAGKARAKKVNPKYAA